MRSVALYFRREWRRARRCSSRLRHRHFAGTCDARSKIYGADIGDKECTFEESIHWVLLSTNKVRPVVRFSGLLCQDLIPSRSFPRKRSGHNIGNDFLDFGVGNSRSRSAKSSLVNLISIDRAFSRTCFSLLAFGIAIISG